MWLLLSSSILLQLLSAKPKSKQKQVDLLQTHMLQLDVYEVPANDPSTDCGGGGSALVGDLAR